VAQRRCAVFQAVDGEDLAALHQHFGGVGHFVIAAAHMRHDRDLRFGGVMRGDAIGLQCRAIFRAYQPIRRPEHGRWQEELPRRAAKQF